jgi:hypothetical protein
MSRQRLTVYVLFALAALPSFVAAQVMDEKARQSKLDAIARVAEPAKGELAECLNGADDPFFTSRIKSSGQTASGRGANDQAGDLSPDAILEGAAALLRPTGIMMGATRRFVVSAQGDLYEVGKTVRVTLADGPHAVTIVSADSEGYVLKCGTATISKKYDDNSGGDKPAK